MAYAVVQALYVTDDRFVIAFGFKISLSFTDHVVHLTRIDWSSHDVNNLGKGAGGGSCTAAAFLREFVPKDTPWIHVDMAGVMGNCTDQTYTGSKGMTGRPMRTLVEFVCSEAGVRQK